MRPKSLLREEQRPFAGAQGDILRWLDINPKHGGSPIVCLSSRLLPHGIISAMFAIDSHTLEVKSHSAEQTRGLGARLGTALQTGDMICLQGDLGAGKTTFVQGIAQGWNSVDSVSSPTFILVNLYRRADGGQVFHMDAYRLDSTGEAEELDLDSMLAEGALIVEWPERMQGLIPNERLWVEFTQSGEEERELKFNARGERYTALLDSIRGGA